MKKTPVCFIAMAFGYDDTDAFYEKQILPTLKRNGITPIIINRHQSNDDLNLQIFTQLDQADFCIADLTYTRPSVYFEAGYAQREIPVIYTVREDHLKKGQPEDLRVHFDLQMKPIIKWSSLSDTTFSQRLEDRIKATFLKDWNKKKEVDEKYELAKKQFQQLPQYEKLYRMRKLALYELRKVGINFPQWEKVKFSFYSDSSHHTGDFPKKSISGGYIDHIFGSTKVNNKIFEISLQTYNSLNKRDLWDLQGAYYRGIFHNDMRSQYKKSPVFSHNIVLSLRSITSNQIESVFSNFSPVINSKRYVITFTDDILIPSRTVVNTFHFLSGIESEYVLKELLEDLIDNHILKQLKKKI